MTTERKNFSGQTTPKIIDAEYRNCNFSQPAPVDGPGGKVGVRLFPGDDTPRRFVECNLTNAMPPPGSDLSGGTGCNTTVRESQVESGVEVVEVGGREVEIKAYEDIIYGRANRETLKMEYKAEPTRIPTDPPEGSLDAKIKALVAEREAATAEAAEKEADAVKEAESLPMRGAQL